MTKLPITGVSPNVKPMICSDPWFSGFRVFYLHRLSENSSMGVEKHGGALSPSKYHGRVPLPSKNFLSTSSGQQKHAGHASDGTFQCVV